MSSTATTKRPSCFFSKLEMATNAVVSWNERTNAPGQASGMGPCAACIRAVFVLLCCIRALVLYPCSVSQTASLHFTTQEIDSTAAHCAAKMTNDGRKQPKRPFQKLAWSPAQESLTKAKHSMRK